jgi:hypothetical protein
MAESSLLDGRTWPAMEREDGGLEASDRDRLFGEGRNGGPSRLALSPAGSVSMPDLPNSVR